VARKQSQCGDRPCAVGSVVLVFRGKVGADIDYPRFRREPRDRQFERSRGENPWRTRRQVGTIPSMKSGVAVPLRLVVTASFVAMVASVCDQSPRREPGVPDLAAGLMRSIIPRNSGTHEPQLVPARSARPRSATLTAPPNVIAFEIAESPTLKQTQIAGPTSVAASLSHPESNIRRSCSVTASNANSDLAVSQPGGAGAGPTMRAPFKRPA
jgi:hypothetical protein